MLGNRKADTKPELRLRSELHRRGLRFRKNFATSAGGRRIVVDVVFPRHRLAVFVDGCFWHMCPEHGTSPNSNRWYWTPKLRRNAERDGEVDELLRAIGWRVLRVWEHTCASSAAGEIEAALRGPNHAMRHADRLVDAS